MPRPRPEALHEAARWELALAFEPRGGAGGERLGSGTGASLEFQDRRAYVAGDDVRHIDWRAFARTDQLLVRQFREEVLPRVELLVDDSASMAVEEDKAAVSVDLALVLARAAQAVGARVVLTALGDEPRRVPLARVEAEGLELSGRRPLQESLDLVAPRLARGSLRVLVSDLLSPADPDRVARRLARGAGGVTVVQVLGAEELEPPVGAAVRLEEAETGATRDLVLSAPVRARYQQRLAALRAAWGQSLRARGARLVALEGPTSLASALREGLAPAGVLRPR